MLPASRRLVLALAVFTFFTIAGCQQPLPEQDSYAGQLYLRQCGQCHQPYNPSSMTATMWATQVDLMQEKMQQTGLAPLTPAERHTILEYLSSNAGKQ